LFIVFSDGQLTTDNKQIENDAHRFGVKGLGAGVALSAGFCST
jgi:hypothetical protein